jgi:Tol biopolymer transport system component
MARRGLATWLTVAFVGVVAIAAVVTAFFPGENSDTAGQDSSSSLATTASPAPTTPADDPPTEWIVLDRPFFLDLRTGEQTLLAENLANGFHFAASRDGTRLAYVQADEEEPPQIFIAGIDGSGVSQMTHDPIGADFPAWSPDGTRIAFVGFGSEDVRNLFVLDLATEESTQITDENHHVWESQFTPDGSSLIYTAGRTPVVRTVPVGGGKSTVLIGPGEGVTVAGQASLSPDGSLVTFLGSGSPIQGRGHCGDPCQLMANADGTERRIIRGGCWYTNPAGTWSPDGSRIVCSNGRGGITVFDIAKGEGSRVARGGEAIWLDGHTLLVENVRDIG